MCKGFQSLIQDVVFQDDLLVFPIDSNDVVMGIQWLYILEDIKFNVKKLLIEFEYEGKLLTLQGIQPKLKDVQSKALEKVDRSNSKLFMVKVRGAKGEVLKATRAEDTQE